MAKSLPLSKEEIEARRGKLRASCAPKWTEHPQLAWHWEVMLSGMSQGAKLTACALWCFSRGDMRRVRPSVQTLALMVGVHERSVSRNLAELQDAGFIDRELGKGKLSTSYELKLSKAVQELNVLMAHSRRDDTSVTPDTHVSQSNETSYLSYMSTRGDDMPTERFVRRCFEELQRKIARIDHNHILSRYLWHEKGFIGFMQLADKMGYDEIHDHVCKVAARENARCTKGPESIKTWSYFAKIAREEPTGAE